MLKEVTTTMQTIESERPGKKIRVLFVSHSPHFYGAEQSFCFLLENLDRERIEPIVVLPPCPAGFDDILYQRIAARGIRTHFIDSRLWLDFAERKELPERLFLELSVVGQYLSLIADESIDLVYTNTITKIAGAIAAKLAGIPHVYHVREVLEDHPLNSPFGDETTFRIIDALSDRIVTNSKAVARQFTGISTPAKVTPVYNAVETSSFEGEFETNLLRQELSLPAEVPLLGIIGTVHRHKNHEELIRALALLKERKVPGHLLIIGYRVQEYAQYLESLISSLDIADAVHFIEFRDDMPQVYHDLDLVVVASLGEPFGRTTIEAMAAGKPVVATNAGASPEIVVDGVTGYLVPLGAPDRMADAIAEIIGNPERARNMGLSGKTRGREHFSPQSYVSGVQAVISEAASIAKLPVATPTALLAQLLEIVPGDELKWFVATAAGHLDQVTKHLTSLSESSTLSSESGDLKMENSRLREQLMENTSALGSAEMALQTREGEIAGIRGSLSWKITAPLRALSAPLAGMLAKLRQ